MAQMQTDSGAKAQARVVFLGAARTGKSAIVKRFVHDVFEEEYKSTVEDLHSVEHRESGGSLCFRMEILDTSGSYSFPAMRRLAIRHADACVLVFSLDDPGSFEEVRRLRDEIQGAGDRACGPAVCVVGNKSDVRTDQDLLEEIPYIVEREWGYCYKETSARDDKGVLQLFRELLVQLRVPWSTSLEVMAPQKRKRREALVKQKHRKQPRIASKINSCLVS
uniref:ras-related protein Rap-2c-like n=1 Tax=Myxine glutinosa TaxID=7769 RepID=UPI00358E0905